MEAAMFSTSTLIRQIRDEYQHLPGLKLTREQACRLWAVNNETCDAAIDALVEEGFLQRTGTGKFIALPRRAGAAAHIRELAAQVPPIRCPHCQKLNMQRDREPGAPSASTHVAGSTFRCIACGRIVSFTALSA
jgi:DNA-binding GntR family transcriptional regulator